MKNILIQNIDKIHTTELGIIRIKKNLKMDISDIVIWCKKQIMRKNSNIIRKGKNWYITIDNYIITINAYSYTIITAHKLRE